MKTDPYGRKTMRTLGVAGILWAAGSALAAGLECTKAVVPVEKVICGDPQLLRLDRELATAYEDAMPHIGNRRNWAAAQQTWVDARNRCIDKRCVRRAYENRLSEVSELVLAENERRSAPPASAAARAAETRTEPAKSEPPTRVQAPPVVSAPALPAPAHAEVEPAARLGARPAPAPASRPAAAIPPSQAVAASTAERSGSDQLKPFRPSVPLSEAAPRTCAFDNLQLPGDFRIYASGGYTGRVLGFQIDQSGHAATQFDVAVNVPDKPVVLMLGAYEPTIWKIGWTPGTRIVAVLVSGYHRQVIAGLDPRVPTLNSSYDNRGPCGYFYVSADRGLDKLNPLARTLFGKPVDLVYPAANGAARIGEPIGNVDALVTHPASPPDSFRNASSPLAGPAGLEEAVRTGALRRATAEDAQAWSEAVAAATPRRDVPPVAGVGVPKPRAPSVFRGYVVLREFTYPAGLYGGNSATFFIPKGVPRPAGEPGHSAVYDFNTLSCYGAICGGGR